MKLRPHDSGMLTNRPSSEVRLSLGDLFPAALGAAGVFIGPLVAHASLAVTLAGTAAAAVFLSGSLVVLHVFGRKLVPAVLSSAASGAVAAFVYWILARPDLTPIGTSGLGAIGGAVIAPFELIWLQYRHDVALIEAESESGFVYTGLFSTLWRSLLLIRRYNRELKRGPTERGDGAA